MSTSFTYASISVTNAWRRVEHMYQPRGRAVMLIGPSGCGKTEIGLQLIRRLQAARAGMGGCYFNFSNAQSTDVSGWPIPCAGPLSMNGVPHIFQPMEQHGLRGAYPVLCPEHLRHPDAPDNDVSHHFHNGTLDPSLLLPYDEGILIADEAGKTNSEADQSTLTMLGREGRTGQWGVPTEGWARVFLTNARAHGSRDLDFPAHFRNSTAVFHVYISYEDVKPYWQSIGMHPDFVAFAASETGYVLSSDVPLGQEQFSTARSWKDAWIDCMHFCMNIAEIPDANAADPSLPYSPVVLPVYGADHPDPVGAANSKEFLATVAACCGDAVTLKFEDYLLHTHERPAYDDIVAKPDQATIPTHAGVAHSVIDMLVANAKIADMDPVCRYLKRFPKAMVGVFCGDMARKHELAMARCKPFNDLVAHTGTSARVGIFSVNV